MSADSNLVLGYDARQEMNAGLLKMPAYRDGYLYKEDVLSLASVDDAIWPSIFDDEKQQGIQKKPAYVGPQGLWADTSFLANHLPADKEGLTMVAIQLIPTKATKSALEEWLTQIETLSPLDRMHTWKLLGYDVADRYLTSSLFNCGLGDDRHALLVDGQPVKFLLNQYHLFGTAQQADQFVALSNESVKEHAPFLTYGIWQASSPFKA